MKEYTIKITKLENGNIRFEWDEDAPILAVCEFGKSAEIQSKPGVKNSYKVKFVGDVDYYVRSFHLKNIMAKGSKQI